MNNPRNKIFVSVTTAMGEVADDPVDIYWLSKQFYKLQLKHCDILTEMVILVKLWLKLRQYPAIHTNYSLSKDLHYLKLESFKSIQ